MADFWLCMSKKEGKDQQSIQSSTAPDPRYQWESNKLTIRHHTREPRGHPFSSRTDDHKATINRRAWKHNKHTTEITWLIHKRSTAFERSVKSHIWPCSYPCITLPCSNHQSIKTHPLFGIQTYTDSQRLLQVHIFPRTIIHWNALPANIPTLPTLAQFSSTVCRVIHVFP